jgi:hypothetical protein
MDIPSLFATALVADGWYLRAKLPWLKRSAMPESVTDRPASAIEYVFLLTRSARYFWDAEAVKRGAQRAGDIPGGGYGEGRDPQRLISKGWARGEVPSARNMRNSDLFYDSLEMEPEPAPASNKPPTWRRARLAWPNSKQDGAYTNDKHTTVRYAPSEPLGLICSDDGSPLALDVNPAAFSEWAQTTRQVYVAWDAAVDGKKRKASPDCPVHEGRLAQAPNARRDAHAASSDLFHSLGNDTDPEIAPVGGCEPFAPLPEQAIAGQSSGFPLPAHSLSATPHNSQSHRTDLAPATSPPCIVSAQTADRTADTSGLRDPVDSAGRTCWSSSAASGSPDGQTTQMACDSVHIPDEAASSSASSAPKCTCTWYVEKTEKTSHFATFPPKLVDPLIRAGTSEIGCCNVCGTPWARKTWKEVVPLQATNNPRSCDQNSRGAMPRSNVQHTTTGWAPTCGCNAGAPVPCTVLDPFAGAGTTLLVCDRLQRDAIGIELSPAYGAMATERVVDDAPLLAWLEAAQ